MELYTEYVNPPDYILPHSDFGDPECCGLLLPFERGDFVDIICNECGAIVRTVEVNDLNRTLDEMQLKLDAASERLGLRTGVTRTRGDCEKRTTRIGREG